AIEGRPVCAYSPLELARQHLQSLVHDRPDAPPRMILGNPLLAAHIAEKRPRLPILAPHGAAPKAADRESRQDQSPKRFFSSLLAVPGRGSPFVEGWLR